MRFITIASVSLSLSLFALGCGASSNPVESPPTASREATSIGNEAQPSEPAAAPSVTLVVVVQGQEYWMGNETYRPENDLDRMEGAFVGVVTALDELGRALPEAVDSALLAYDDGVTTVKALGPEPLNADSLGPQQRYADAIGRSLVAGLAEAQVLLSRDDAGRKILVVIGDGEGQREDITSDLAAQIEALQAIGAEVFTIHHTPRTGATPVGHHNMETLGYSGHYSAVSRLAITSFAKTIAAAIER